MRAQRVYLRDSRHRRNERGTEGTTRSYEVAVLVRLPHQFLCDDVHNGVSVGNNGVQLSLEARGNDLRQLLAVDFMRAVVADSPQCLVGILDDRREFSGTDSGDFLDKVGDFARIGDDYLLRFLTSEIRKLLSISSVVRRNSGACSSASSKPFPVMMMRRRSRPADP